MGGSGVAVLVRREDIGIILVSRFGFGFEFFGWVLVFVGAGQLWSVDSFLG